MKLRIRGNSIRLRLLKSEVARLGKENRVAESITFGPLPTDRMRYAIEVSDQSEEVSAGMRQGEIFVSVPAAAASNWINTEQVGIQATIANGEEPLEIIIEKDFVCLTRTDDPDDSDAFPNPDSNERC